MTFSNEQTAKIKSQLLTQVEQLPNENKDQIKQYIKSLDNAGLEAFLKQQNIKATDQGLEQVTGDQERSQPKVGEQGQETSIFESIIKGEIPSYKLEENDKAIAILELNPLSYGHSLIIPKQKTTIEKIPKIAFTLAQKIAKRIKTKLKAEDVKIETFSFQDYPAINIIPTYKGKPLQKTKAEEKELKTLQNKLSLKTRIKKTKTLTSKDSKIKNNLPEIHFRIP